MGFRIEVDRRKGALFKAFPGRGGDDAMNTPISLFEQVRDLADLTFCRSLVELDSLWIDR